MNNLMWETIEEMNLGIAKRMRLIRKRKKISQEMLATKSAVSLGSIKRFESTGEISLKSLTKIAVALNCEGDLKNLFTKVPYESIEEVINESKSSRR